MLRRTEKILEVYIEASQPSELEGPAESRPVKLEIPDVSHPEWAAGALRRIRNVTKIIEVGDYADGPSVNRHVIKILYDPTHITDDDSLQHLSKLVHDAIYSSARGSNL